LICCIIEAEKIVEQEEKEQKQQKICYKPNWHALLQQKLQNLKQVQ